jgi:rSAM/selenodomain-associated transferase 1
LSRTSQRALLIFTRNPEPGKCKTRLAASIGDLAALNIYRFLVQHTATIARDLQGVDRMVYFSEQPVDVSFWAPAYFNYKVQTGEDLGARMLQAFREAFSLGYSEAVLIGSDLYDLSSDDLRKAFGQLGRHDVVLGPAGDGGYYLIGMKKAMPLLFQGKKWGTDTVLKETLQNLKEVETCLLPVRNDVDRYEDIEGNPVFEPFLNQKNHD